MIKVKDGYAKLIGTTYSGSASRVLLSNGGDHVLGNASGNIPLNNGTVSTNLNADMLDGLHIHTGRNNEANKVVRTDASGYIQAGWINTTSGDMGTTAATRIYCSNDGYIRYKTPANFFSVLANSSNQLSITVGDQNRKVTVAYATSSGNSDTLDNYHANSFIFHQKYSSLSALPSGTDGWYKVGSVSDTSGSACIFVVRAYAHSSAIFTVSKGYSTSGNITVLQYCNSGNGSYAYVKGARLISDGTVEILLNKPSANNSTYVNIFVAMYNADNIKPLTALTLDTGSPTVIQTKTFTNDSIAATTFVGNLSGNATSATQVIVNQHTANNTEYPLVWSNQNNTNSALSNQLYKSYSHLTYNPSLQRITAAILRSAGILQLVGTSGIYLKYNNADATSLVLNATWFKPFDAANNKLTLGSASARWSNVYSYLGNFKDTVYIYADSSGNYTEGIRLYGTAKDSTWSIINFGCDPAATSGTHANQWLFGRDNANRLVFRNNATDQMYLTTTGLGIGVVPTQKLHVNGNAIATNFGVNSTAGSGQGISLYGGSGHVATYGIAFVTTGNWGTHGYVTGDWATYFTMSNTENRGWIFRRNGSGNVFSIDCDGHAYANGLVNASRFHSRVATGTQPYACTSTTCNTNLNADLLDGYHASGIWEYGTSLSPYNASSTGWYLFLTLVATTNDGQVDFIVSGAETGQIGIADYFHFATRPSSPSRVFNYMHLGLNHNDLRSSIYAYTSDNKTYKFYVKYETAGSWIHFCKIKHVSSRGCTLTYSNTWQTAAPSGTAYQATFSGAINYASSAGNADTVDSLHASAFMRAVSANGYYGMGEPGGGTSNWIRTTVNGIIPYQSGGASNLGTSSWPFSTVYAKNFYGYLNGNISGSAASAGYTTRLYANSTSNLTTTPGEYSLAYSRFQSGVSNIFPVSNNANGVITAHLHSGDYYAQIGLSSNGRMYYRTMMAQTLSAGVAWKAIAFTSDIPSIPSVSISNSGSGNAVTSITASGHTLTVTKGSTFLTSHQSLANCLRSTAWVGNPGQDANSMTNNTMNFTYSNNAPYTGPIIYFAGASGGSYGLQINASYSGGTNIAFRTRNGDNGTWNSWYRLARANEIPNPANYYWANIKVSASSSTSTSPTFATSYATTHQSSSLIYLKTGDATMKIYANVSNSSSYGNEGVTIQTAFDGQDPASSSYPSSYPTRAVLQLQPRGGNVAIGQTTANSYKVHISGSLYASSWLRTGGSTGWYSESYGGGIFMQDTTWVRVYNGKSFYVPGNAQIDGTLYLYRTTDAAATTDNRPALIVGGGPTSTHIEMDSNEIIAKTNGTTISTLYLNSGGAASTVRITESTVGSSYNPVYLNAGAITACSVPMVRYWAVYQIFHGTASNVSFTKKAGNHNFFTSGSTTFYRDIQQTILAVISYPSGWNEDTTMIFGNGSVSNTSDYYKPCILTVQKEVGDGSKVRFIMSDDASVENRACYAWVYFLCIG